jgi:hypothetical protein
MIADASALAADAIFQVDYRRPPAQRCAMESLPGFVAGAIAMAQCLITLNIGRVGAEHSRYVVW